MTAGLRLLAWLESRQGPVNLAETLMPDEFSEQPHPPEEAADRSSTSANATSSSRGCQSALQEPAATRKQKTIVVCCDGTGNEFAGKDAQNSNSNVVKLYTALEINEHQVAYYHPGVGTMGDPTEKGIGRSWSVVKGLAFGSGFRENVLDAYRYLMQHYNSGDRVFLFGFSRGAYTARALAGLLHGYGLLCRGNESHLPYAWRTYTQRIQEGKQQERHSIPADFSFRDTFSHRDFILHFVGFWDTVSSVGWISSPLRLLNLAQNSTIVCGRHAVSIDERRCFYQDNLWGPPVRPEHPLGRVARGEVIPEMQDLLQVWFAGVHSDVGGSYPQLTAGLANITFRWMLDEARAKGLATSPERCKMLLGEPFDAEAADPNGQLAPLYEPPRKPFELHDSLTLPWWILELFPHRYYDRDDARERMRIPLGFFRRIPAKSLVHNTVHNRLSTDPCYNPPNIKLAELDPTVDAPHADSPALGALYTFHPKECRCHDLRENWLFVFLVSLVEVGLALYLLLHVVMRLGPLFYVMGQAFVWIVRYLHPRQLHRYSHGRQLSVAFLAALVVIVISTIRRRLRS